MPPSAPRVFGRLSRAIGPNKTKKLNKVHATMAISIHAPMRAHHSRSSSDVLLLETPMKSVARRRNNARKAGTAKQLYKANPGGSFTLRKLKVAAIQRKIPPSAPVSTTAISSQRKAEAAIPRQ